MGWSPRCYKPSFVEIGLPVLEKKIFECFFTIYGRGGHLGHVIKIPRTNFRSPYPWMLHIKIQFDWPSGFREDLRNCGRRTDRRRTDGRLTDWHTISSPCEPSAQVRLKKNNNYILHRQVFVMHICEYNILDLFIYLLFIYLFFFFFLSNLFSFIISTHKNISLYVWSESIYCSEDIA